MKKIAGFILMIIFAMSLMACGSTDDQNISIEFKDFDYDLTWVSFSIELSDPDERITGNINIELFENDTRRQTRVAQVLEDLENITFSGLTTGTTYEIRVIAGVGREAVTIGERTFTTLSDQPISIETPEDFMNMRNNRSGQYILENDLDFEGVEFKAPFGQQHFSGTFDGQGFTISNIEFTSMQTYTGVFGYITTGKVFDVHLENIIIGTEEDPIKMTTSTRAGIISGYQSNTNSEITNITVKNSQIYMITSSTVHAYVGGAIGEARGKVEDITLENVTVSVVSEAQGRIKLGAVVGYLYDSATLKRVSSQTDVIFELDFKRANTRDMDFSILIGGIIGENAPKTNLRAVENVYNIGDINVDLAFNTPETSTKGNYTVYVGGVAGMSYANIYQSFYKGNISLNHEKNEFEEGVVNKFIFVGGLMGSYASRQTLNQALKINNDGKEMNVNVSDDVTLLVSQTIARFVHTPTVHTGLIGSEHLMVNGVDQSASEDVTIILDPLEFFLSDWMKEKYEVLFINDID